MNTHASASHHWHLLTLALLASFSGSALAGDVLAPSARASTPPGGGDANSFSRLPSISADGRFTAFATGASNLLPGDSNNTYDIYLYDRVANALERISQSTTGGDSDNVSFTPSISGDGRYVCFESAATNLTVPAGSGIFQIYVRDRQLGITLFASTNSTGAQPNNTTETSVISADGRWVAFLSHADNLVVGDTNNQRDAFLKDLQTGATTRVSLGAGGTQPDRYSYDPAISGDGRYVAYRTDASNIVAGGTGPFLDHVYLYDRIASTTILLSQLAGVQADTGSRLPVISDDGQFVAFYTDAQNILPPPQSGAASIALYERATGTLERVNLDHLGHSFSLFPVRCSLSSDARFVAMVGVSGAPQNGGLFVRDRQLGLTIAACSNDDGAQPGGPSVSEADISADGSMVAMGTMLSLEPGDVMNQEDIYVRGAGAPAAYCFAKTNSQGCQPRIGFTGEARVSNNYALTITCTNVLNNKNGLLLHGVGGPRQAPFQGGFLCVKPPFARSLLQNSGGNPPPNDCSGSWSANLGTVLAQSQIGPLVGLGTPVYVQWWGRDPAFAPPDNVQLSDALQIVVGP